MNQATYTGNLGADPRSNTLQSGTNVCDFNIAVNRRYTQGGQTVEETVWVKVTAWRNLAQNCARFLSKGSKVLVTGRTLGGRDEVVIDGASRWQVFRHVELPRLALRFDRVSYARLRQLIDRLSRAAAPPPSPPPAAPA